MREDGAARCIWARLTTSRDVQVAMAMWRRVLIRPHVFRENLWITALRHAMECRGVWDSRSIAAD